MKTYIVLFLLTASVSAFSQTTNNGVLTTHQATVILTGDNVTRCIVIENIGSTDLSLTLQINGSGILPLVFPANTKKAYCKANITYAHIEPTNVGEIVAVKWEIR